MTNTAARATTNTTTTTTSSTTPPSKLLTASQLYGRDELDESLERCHAYVCKHCSGRSEAETISTLQKAVARGARHHEDVQLGFLYGILTEPDSAQRLFQAAAFTSQDGLRRIVDASCQLVLEKWSRMNDSARRQTLWLLGETVRNGTARCDALCYHLLRQVAVGDPSPRNASLAEAVLDVLIENFAWLEAQTTFIPVVVYAYLRLVQCHRDERYEALRKKETDLCVGLLRSRWQECQSIGRDLLRLLHGLTHVAEFEALLRDVVDNPTSLHPHFAGPSQIVRARTSRRYFVNSLTPDMEKKLSFLATEVRYGSHSRYQAWFRAQFLPPDQVDSQLLIPDLIRYLCAVVSPSSSETEVPRWHLAGWLLTCCTTHEALAKSVLALFYDCLFFSDHEGSGDGLASIEPCLQLACNAVDGQPVVARKLVEFMCRAPTDFVPALFGRVRRGMADSLRTAAERRIVPSLAPLFDCAKLGKRLVDSLRAGYPELCQFGCAASIASDRQPEEARRKVEKEEEEERRKTEEEDKRKMEEDRRKMEEDKRKMEEDKRKMEEDKRKMEEDKRKMEEDKRKMEEDKMKIEEDKRKMKEEDKMKKEDDKRKEKEKRKEEEDEEKRKANDDEKIKSLIVLVHREQNEASRCEHLDRLLRMIARRGIGDDDLGHLAACLREAVEPCLRPKLVPGATGPGRRAVFALFGNLVRARDGEEGPAGRTTLAKLVERMRRILPKIGYYFLCYLEDRGREEEEEGREKERERGGVGGGGVGRRAKLAAYRDFVESAGRSLEASLLQDLSLVSDDERNDHDESQLLVHLAPTVYSEFSEVAVGNCDMARLIAGSLDAGQLLSLTREIVFGRLTMLAEDSLERVVAASLDWETYEQYNLWQIVSAHGFRSEAFAPSLERLDWDSSAEALCNLIGFVARDGPTPGTLRAVLSRRSSADGGGESCSLLVLASWARRHGEALADLLALQLDESSGASRAGDHRPPPLELILSHLDGLRASSSSSSRSPEGMALLGRDSVQRSLRRARASAPEELRAKFIDSMIRTHDGSLRCGGDVKDAPARRSPTPGATSRSSRSSTSPTTPFSPPLSSSSRTRKRKFDDGDDGYDQRRPERYRGGGSKSARLSDGC